jgi:hypothetical protein
MNAAPARQRGMKKMLRQVKYAGDEALRSGKLDEAIRHYSFCITAASRGGFIKSSRVVVLLGRSTQDPTPKTDTSSTGRSHSQWCPHPHPRTLAHG